MHTPEFGPRFRWPLRRFLTLAAAVVAVVALLPVSVQAQRPINLPGDGARTPGAVTPPLPPRGVADIEAAPAVDPTVDDVATSVGLETSLFRELNIPEDDISVSVAGGVVTVRGTVDTLLQRDRITEIAQSMRGIHRVVNRVAVRTPRLTDQALLDRINAALASDSVAGTLRIGVTVNQGVATLTGAVDSWQTQQLVTNVVKAVPGVTAINSRISFSTPNRSDDEIRQDIQRRLEVDRWIDPGLVDVRVQNGRVTLSGTVGSLFEQNRAITDAWVPGVTHVSSEGLAVEAGLREEMQRTRNEARLTDRDIRAAVSNAFAFNPRMVSLNQEIYVENGVVTLRGLVDTPRAREAAEELASGVVGVRGVNNLLQVRESATATADAGQPAAPTNVEQAPTQTVSTEETDPVLRAVRDAITADSRLDNLNVSASRTDEGVVLFGIVDSEDTKSHAGNVVASVSGVDNVVNNISVGDRWKVGSDGIRRSDEQIARDIQTSLNWSPFVQPEAITVTVTDGVVTLDGTVESWRESIVAARAATVAGATEVHNNLQVLRTAQQEMEEMQLQLQQQQQQQAATGVEVVRPGVAVQQPVPGAQVPQQPGTAPVAAAPGTAAPGTVYYDASGAAVVGGGVGGVGAAQDADAIDQTPGAQARGDQNVLQGRNIPTEVNPGINPNTAPTLRPNMDPPFPQAGGTQTPDIDTGAPTVPPAGAGSNVGPQFDPNFVPAGPNQVPQPPGQQPGGTVPTSPITGGPATPETPGGVGGGAGGAGAGAGGAGGGGAGAGGAGAGAGAGGAGGGGGGAGGAGGGGGGGGG